MLTELQGRALKIINSRAGITVTELGATLGRDRKQAGRLADLLAERGFVRRWDGGRGFAYGPLVSSAPATNAPSHA
jgi:DNA-binding MarR family transcriptional regulator